MYFRAFFRCGEIRSQNVWKVIICWSIKWRLLLLRQWSSHLQIAPQRGLKRCFWPETPTKLSVPPLYSPFWTHYMQYLQGSKKRDGGSNRSLNGESAKETMLSEIRVRPPFIISSCTVCISWLFRMSAKCVRNLGRTIGRVSAKRQKEHCDSFSLGKGGKARWFLNLYTNEDK